MENAEADLALFARLSADAQHGYEDAAADAWDTSPFRWMRRRSSRQKGAIGKAIVKDWATHEGIRVQAATGPGHDFQLNGVLVTVKFSMLWSSGQLVFEQLRDQDYDVACLLGVEPQRVRLWAVPKDIIWKHAPGQHTGAAAQETRWVRFRADTPSDWLQSYGGTLNEAKAALEQARRDLGR